MTTIKIQREKEIWDDENYCSVNDDDHCPHLAYRNGNQHFPQCLEFRTRLKDETTDEVDQWEYRIVKPIKCDECKKAWQSAKRIKCTCMTKTPEPKYHDESCPVSKMDYDPSKFVVPNIS
jgi:hypothetical protein